MRWNNRMCAYHCEPILLLATARRVLFRSFRCKAGGMHLMVMCQMRLIRRRQTVFRPPEAWRLLGSAVLRAHDVQPYVDNRSKNLVTATTRSMPSPKFRSGGGRSSRTPTAAYFEAFWGPIPSATSAAPIRYRSVFAET